MAASRCGGDTGVSCSDYCLCDIRALTGAEFDACQNSVTPPSELPSPDALAYIACTGAPQASNPPSP